MKNKEDLKVEAGKLISHEVERFKLLETEINWFIENNEINEEGLRRLQNIFSEVCAIKDTYTTRIFNILKQNHMLD